MKTRWLLAGVLSVALIWLNEHNQSPAPLHSTDLTHEAAQPVEKKLPDPEPSQVVQAVEPERPQAQAKVAVQETNTPDAWMNALGIPEDERPAVRYIMEQESKWCPTRWEGEYGACQEYHGVPEGNVGYGLCQATPAHKMASAGADWQTNPVTQLKWCAEHMQGYGSWTKAAEFKRCTGWCYSTKIAASVFKRTPYW